MRKQSVIHHTLADHDFGHLSKIESDPRARVRLLILHQFALGIDYKEIAKNNSMAPDTVLRIRRNYWRDGLITLYDKPRPGRNSKLAPEHYEDFKKLIIQKQLEKPEGRLIGEDIALLAKEHFGADYRPDAIYPVLKRLGISWITGQNQPTKADLEKTRRLKKVIAKAVEILMFRVEFG